MADGTHIEWTNATWNPITGCMIKSSGCLHCYAMILAATRLQHHPSRAGLTREVNGNLVWTGEVRFNEQWLDQPRQWKIPRDIFVVAHGDLFYEKVPDRWITTIFEIMERAPQHRYQILTKRPDRANEYDRANGPHQSSNIWIGTSVERQQEADERRPYLEALARAGWNTWVSYEPALGPVNWSGWEFIRWVVSGGESGPKSRPSHPDWHRTTRDWCISNKIPYFFKQVGNWQSILDRDREDPDWRAPYTRYEVDPTYRFINLAGGCGFHGPRLHVMRRVGKKAAGALLDGREWKEFPEARNV